MRDPRTRHTFKGLLQHMHNNTATSSAHTNQGSKAAANHPAALSDLPIPTLPFLFFLLFVTLPPYYKHAHTWFPQQKPQYQLV
jgi:hypothetical protein